MLPLAPAPAQGVARRVVWCKPQSLTSFVFSVQAWISTKSIHHQSSAETQKQPLTKVSLNWQTRRHKPEVVRSERALRPCSRECTLRIVRVLCCFTLSLLFLWRSRTRNMHSVTAGNCVLIGILKHGRATKAKAYPV